jgi:hypothetical protein
MPDGYFARSDWAHQRSTLRFSPGLALKAYLMVNGYSVDFFRKLNHDLTKAMNLALSHQLSLSGQHQAIIASLSEQHNRSFSFRYFNPDGWSAPNFLNVERCCRRLLLDAQGPIFKANGLILLAEHRALER